MKRVLWSLQPAIVFVLALAMTSCSLTGIEDTAGKGAAPSGCAGLNSSVCDRQGTYWDKDKGQCIPLSTLCGPGTEFKNGRCVLAGSAGASGSSAASR